MTDKPPPGQLIKTIIDDVTDPVHESYGYNRINLKHIQLRPVPLTTVQYEIYLAGPSGSAKWRRDRDQAILDTWQALAADIYFCTKPELKLWLLEGKQRVARMQLGQAAERSEPPRPLSRRFAKWSVDEATHHHKQGRTTDLTPLPHTLALLCQISREAIPEIFTEFFNPGNVYFTTLILSEEQPDYADPTKYHRNGFYRAFHTFDGEDSRHYTNHGALATMLCPSGAYLINPIGFFDDPVRGFNLTYCPANNASNSATCS